MVDARLFNYGADAAGNPTNAFWEALESTGEQFAGVSALRLRQEQVLELGMTLPEWETGPDNRPDVMSSLLCELRAYKTGLTELETLWHRGRWAFRSRRFHDAVALLARYLHDAEPSHARVHPRQPPDAGGAALDGAHEAHGRPAKDRVLPSATLASRPDRERAWARIMLAYAEFERGDVNEALYYAGEATEHHGRTMREVWFHATQLYERLSRRRDTQRFGYT